MTTSVRIPASALTTLAITLICMLAAITSRPAQAQTFSVIHGFTGGRDGLGPMASLTIGGAGTLYGTTYAGGGVNGRDCDPRTQGCGVVFKMTQHNGGWIFSPLYAFNDFDGAGPAAPVAYGPGGLLYGSTTNGGNNLNCFGNFY